MEHEVLIVDSDPRNVRSLLEVLEPAGIHVHVRTNGRTALEAFHDISPDLVVVGSKMRGTTGRQVGSEIKGTDRGRAIPLIVVTEQGEPEGAGGLDASDGSVVSICKPLGRQRLLDVLAHFLPGAFVASPGMELGVLQNGPPTRAGSLKADDPYEVASFGDEKGLGALLDRIFPSSDSGGLAAKIRHAQEPSSAAPSSAGAGAGRSGGTPAEKPAPRVEPHAPPAARPSGSASTDGKGAAADRAAGASASRPLSNVPVDALDAILDNVLPTREGAGEPPHAQSTAAGSAAATSNLARPAGGSEAPGAPASAQPPQGGAPAVRSDIVIPASGAPHDVGAASVPATRTPDADTSPAPPAAATRTAPSSGGPAKVPESPAAIAPASGISASAPDGPKVITPSSAPPASAADRPKSVTPTSAPTASASDGPTATARKKDPAPVPVAPKAPEEAPALVRPGADQPPSQPVDSAAAKASAASQDASGAQAPRQVSPSAPAAPAPQPPAKPPEVAAPASGGAMPRAAASRPESAVADLAPIPLKSDNPHLAARSAGLDAGAHPAREPAQERAADRRPAKRKKAPYLVAAAVVLGALALVGYMAMRPQESDLRPVAHASRPPMEQDETARTEEPGDSENGAPAGTTETPEDGGSAATLARPGSPEPQTVAPAAGLAPPSTGEHRESGGPQASEASHDAAAGTTRDAARPNDGTSRPNGPDGSRARETSPHSAHASPLPSKTPPPAHAAGPARSSTIAGGAEATIGSGAAHISETASAVPASGARPEGGRAARSTPSSSAVTSPGPDGAARGSLLPVSGAHEAELRARKSGSVTSPSAALAPPAAGTRPGAPLVAGAPAAEERSESDARATQAEEAPTGATPPGTSDAVPGVVTSSLTVPPSLAPSNLNSTGLDPFAVDTVPFASPVPIHHPSPPYPPAALSLNQSGTVVLLLKVGADGRVSEVRVTRPAATLLNQAAVRAAYQWTFRPAEQNGRPVTTWVEETVEFKRR